MTLRTRAPYSWYPVEVLQGANGYRSDRQTASSGNKQGVSDIHIVVGQPPVFRLHGRMKKLETKTLEAEMLLR